MVARWTITGSPQNCTGVNVCILKHNKAFSAKKNNLPASSMMGGAIISTKESRMILANSFSINMVKHHVSVNINFSTIGVEQAAQLIDELNCELAGSGECLVNAIGHPDLDNIARQQLVGVNPLLEIPPWKRLNVMLGPDLDTVTACWWLSTVGRDCRKGHQCCPKGQK